jgi:iron-siderophore transport system permease protein
VSSPPGGLVLRAPGAGLSLRVPRRSVAVGTALAVVLAGLLVVSLGTGDFPVSPPDVVVALLGGGDEGTRFVIQDLRLPRALAGLLVGAALGASGAIFQSATRNPLGSPDVVGFMQGASAAAVAQIIVFDGGTAATAAAAVAGGLGTAALVYALAWRGGAPGYRLILVGIGIAAMLVALTNHLLSRTTLEEAVGAQLWLTGTLNGRGWEHVWPVAIASLVLLPLALLLARSLRTLELGDDAAGALGVAVERSRLIALAVGVCLCAVGTAAAGPIVFVALAAPQIARRLTRASGPGIGCAALTGAALLAAADLGGRLLLPDRELPVGVVTGVLGGVYLIALLTREWRSR